MSGSSGGAISFDGGHHLQHSNPGSYGRPSTFSPLPPPSQLLPTYDTAGGSTSEQYDYPQDYNFGSSGRQLQQPQSTLVTLPPLPLPFSGRRGSGSSVPYSSSSEGTALSINTTTGIAGTGGRGRVRNATGPVNGGRVSGNPPAGVTHCAFCGTTTSPEWRKGVTGIKNLCNA